LSSFSDNAEDGRVDEIDVEQANVTMLYGRLDHMRSRAAERLEDSLRQTGGTPQARSERDSATTRYTDQLAQYSWTASTPTSAGSASSTRTATTSRS
jgi:hypothetical protein